VEKEVTIKLLMENPTPLIKILKVLPEVEEVADESREAKDATGSQKEATQGKRIVIGLSAKNHTESNHGVQIPDKSDLPK
jgi:hypothetical protein